jgi:hypothetical protein
MVESVSEMESPSNQNHSDVLNQFDSYCRQSRWALFFSEGASQEPGQEPVGYELLKPIPRLGALRSAVGYSRLVTVVME